MKQLILLFGCILIPLVLCAQAPGNIPVVFRNTGKMNIAKSAATPAVHKIVNVNVVGSMRMKDGGQVSSVAFTGGIGLTGHFIQDSQGTIFKTNLSGTALDYGFISFLGAIDQHITSEDTLTVDKSVSYVPFSGIELATNNRVILNSKMGIDASSIQRKPGNIGRLWLNSNLIGDNIFDASLRITATSAPVDPGSVVVERYFHHYKSTGLGQSQNSLLFPFATPFASNSQASGYFAGHWVRRATNEYVYGNKDANTDGIIDKDQYVTDPVEKLEPGKAYLVKPRTDADFNSAFHNDGNLMITNGNLADYIKPKFIFDGSVYSFAPVQEQLNVSGVTISNVSTQTNTMTNVVIGNSSTSSISFTKLVDYLANQPLPIYKYLYVYVPGSNSYVPVSMLEANATSPASLIENGDIPPMSVYIVRLPRKATAVTGSFTITPDLYTHGTNGHNLRTSGNFFNEVLFRAENKDNPFQFDMAAIGIRQGASEASEDLDVLKITGPNTSGLQLYTESTNGVKMASNSIPETAKTVLLCAYPNNTDATYTLSAERLESLNNQTVVLEDLKTGSKINLPENNKYTFTVAKNDDPKRFIVHFAPTSGTAIDDVSMGGNLRIYYSNNQLNISGLNTSDLGSNIHIYDLQGRAVKTIPVNVYPNMVIGLDLPKGVFVARVAGNRNISLKFSNK